MNLALQRPTNQFFTKQATRTQVEPSTKYDLWLRSLDPNNQDYILDAAYESATAKFERKPYRGHTFRGYEAQLFQSAEAEHLKFFQRMRDLDEALESKEISSYEYQDAVNKLINYTT